ncbi:MAG: M24 family metallopeptidase [Phycisphaerae bacterium]|nr:M24 family metallopeptidase [Phycisphaerae bacterium]
MTPAEERQIKHQRVVGYLDTHDLDGVLLSRRCNFNWYTGGARNYVAEACDAGNSALLVERAGATVLANNTEAPRLAAEDLAAADLDFQTFDYYDATGAGKAFDAALSGKRVAADVPAAGRELPSLDAMFDRLRWELTPAEIMRYRAVCRDVAEALEAAARTAEPGRSEHDLAGETALRLRAAGCTPWLLLVGTDERIAAYRHPLPTDKRLERKAMLVTCAERGGLVAAMTRLVHFGAIPDELAERHRAAATVTAALLTAMRPGRTLGALFAEAQAAFREAGFADEWRALHVGGSCGYLPRERKAAPGDDTAVLADQAFAWNPSVAGTKCEDTVLCTDEGWQRLSGQTGWPMEAAAWKGESFELPGILSR